MEATASQRYAYDNGFVPMVKDDSRDDSRIWLRAAPGGQAMAVGDVTVSDRVVEAPLESETSLTVPS